MKGFVNLLLWILPSNLLRVMLLKLCGVTCGSRIKVSRGVRLDFPWRLKIGENSCIGRAVYLDCRGGSIHIGSNSDISEGAIIYTLTHDINSATFEIKSGNVIIESRCWVCARAIILPRTVLSKGSVLGANSVFSGRSIDFSLLVGNPARSVKQLSSQRALKVRN
jgi:putative colanic acid biosynthesis acetyltransferase WcaF